MAANQTTETSGFSTPGLLVFCLAAGVISTIALTLVENAVVGNPLLQSITPITFGTGFVIGAALFVVAFTVETVAEL